MLQNQQEQLLSYNGEVLIFQLSEEKSSHLGNSKITKLHVRRMTFDTGTKLFVETSTGSFIMSGEDVEMINCSCACCFRTGILHPCILLKKRKKKNIKYILLFLHNFNKFVVVLHFKLDYELKKPVNILDGPTVLWTYGKQLFHISPQTGTVVCASVQFSSIKWVGRIKDEGTVVLGTRSSRLPEDGDGRSFAKSDAHIWGTECFAYALDKQQVLTTAAFLPHAYGNIVSCVHVCKAEKLRSKFRTSLVAVTCKSQLVLFRDGLPKDVHQLPFEKPCSVQMVVVKGGSQMVLVTFASGDVCAVWKHNFQVAFCWKDVTSILVDDFAGIGTEQILVLKSNSISENLNTFQITDFVKVNYANNITNEEDSSSAVDLQQNCVLTVKALEARLQGGLVSLWDETEKTLENDTSTQYADQEHYVEEIWFRVAEDNLVVGVKLMEECDLLLGDVSLFLIMHQKCPSVFPTRCQSNVVMLKKATLPEHTSCWQLEPCPKRIKLDCHNGKECNGGPFQVKAERTKAFTAVTQLSPFLALHQVHCMVLLHAKKKKCKDGNPQKSKKLTLLCGNILLNLVEIFSGKYSVNLKETGSMKDLVTLCAVLYKQSFQITSTDYTLNPINTWLQKQMECIPIKEFPEYVICCKSGNLNGTLFKWNLRTPFDGILTVFCRHPTVLFQCLHNLIELLPPTCKIKPLRRGSKKGLAEQFALTLVEEIVTLQHPFSSALNFTENMSPNYEENKGTHSISTVQHFKEAFKQEQKQSTVCVNQTMSGALYRGLILNVFESQMKSDLISYQCSLLS
ncbi:Fanconi anemia group B protein isoform X2 [Sceloporus undulatus]|uniref:Fanconi anemia group B protein isoform X2 n=1 Tax=Sceloporus undulatus TaxID=8520 RepID=UPI001C4CB5D6|nr:Fanconi anemia group B protein isoform X2 [Sceloporus undulatus]